MPHIFQCLERENWPNGYDFTTKHKESKPARWIMIMPVANTRYARRARLGTPGLRETCLSSGS